MKTSAQRTRGKIRAPLLERRRSCPSSAVPVGCRGWGAAGRHSATRQPRSLGSRPVRVSGSSRAQRCEDQHCWQSLAHAGAHVRTDALGVCLDALADAPKQEQLVARAAFLAENLAILVFELANGHMPEAVNLLPERRQAGYCVNRIFAPGPYTNTRRAWDWVGRRSHCGWSRKPS